LYWNLGSTTPLFARQAFPAPSTARLSLTPLLSDLSILSGSRGARHAARGTRAYGAPASSDKTDKSDKSGVIDGAAAADLWIRSDESARPA
jgi:hypothetical protein